MVVADELLVVVRADTTQANAAMAGFGKATQSAMGKARASAGALGKSMTKFVTLPLLGVAALGVKAFADFDDAMTQSLAIMADDAGKWRDEMETAAREVAKTTTITATQAAEAYFFLASAGMDAQQAIAAMPQVARFAQAGMFDMATATDLATDAQSALGLTSDDAAENLAGLTRVTDVFVKANTLANTSVEQIAAAMTNKAGPALRAVGKDIEEGAAVLAAFADQGLKGEAAGTALHIVMRDLQTAALKNTDEFKEMGVAVFDAQGEMNNMGDIVGDLEGLLDGMSDAQRKATLQQLGFTDKSIGFIQTLLGTSEAIGEYEAALRDAGGFTESVAAKQLESFKAQWQIFKNKLMDVAITIGSILVPILIELFDMVSPWIEKIGDWIEANDDLALSIGGIIGVVGPLLQVVTRMNPWMLALTAIIVGIAFAADRMGLKFEDIVSWFENVLMPTLQPIFEELEKLIVDVIGTITTFVDDHIVEWMELFQQGVDFILGVWEKLWAVLEPIVAELVAFIEDEVGELVDFIVEIWPMVSEIVERHMEMIQEIWERIWPVLERFLLPIVKALIKIISGALQVIKGIIQTVLAIMTGDWSQAWEGIKKIVTGVWEIIQGVIQGALNIIMAIIGFFWTDFIEVWDGLWEAVTSGFRTAWDGIKAIFVNIANSILEKAEGFINGWIETLNKLIRAANRIPGVNIGTIGLISAPRISLAEGGMVGGAGFVRAKVGERGPETVILPTGAEVVPNGAGGALIGTLITQGKDGRAIAEDIGWELMKRGVGN